MSQDESKQGKLECDVLVVGGGTGGVSAAIWAARTGAKTILIEETGWLGGMMSSAGVSCFDGNNGAHNTGFFREIRTKIESHYGGPQNVKTGWVSKCCFEPHVANDIFRSIIASTPNLSVFFDTKVTKVFTKKNRVTGVQIETEGDKEKQKIDAKITIDASEYGDILEQSDVDYLLGRESKKVTGESDAADDNDDGIQDITYVAILRDYGPGVNKTLPKPTEYDEKKFDCATKEQCADVSWHNHKLHDWESFITYGKLPNNKYMINWPFHGNDYQAFLPDMTSEKREKELEKAKQHTLDFVYYIQTKLGHPELGLADDEFPTDDLLPMIPYNRESRRIVGKCLMKEQDVLPLGDSGRPALRPDSIAIGDYFLDHHHAEPPKGTKGIKEKYPKNAPFQVPYGVLVPKDMEGLMAAEKNISVTHIVNGCTRLQPVVMLIGQACGVAAALCARKDIQPKDLNVKELQDILLQNKDTLVPYSDVYPNHPYFISIQKLGLAGVLPERREQKFYASAEIKHEELINALDKTLDIVAGKSSRVSRTEIQTLVNKIGGEDTVSRSQLAEILVRVAGLEPFSKSKKVIFKDVPPTYPTYGAITRLYRDGHLMGYKGNYFEPEKPMTRAEVALLIDSMFHPWEKI